MNKDIVYPEGETGDKRIWKAQLYWRIIVLSEMVMCPKVPCILCNPDGSNTGGYYQRWKNKTQELPSVAPMDAHFHTFKCSNNSCDAKKLHCTIWYSRLLSYLVDVPNSKYYVDRWSFSQLAMVCIARKMNLCTYDFV